MPSQTGYGYANNSFVWTDWNNQTGWSSNGFVFLAGMLSGAFTIGTPDVVCQLQDLNLSATTNRIHFPRLAI